VPTVVERFVGDASTPIGEAGRGFSTRSVMATAGCAFVAVGAAGTVGVALAAAALGAVAAGLVGRRSAREAARTHAAEHDLRERIATLEAVVEASPVGVNVVGRDGRLRLTNPAMSRILGYDPDERRDRPHHEMMHPEERAAADAALDRLFRRELDELVTQRRIRHADGRWLTLESRARVVLDADDNATGVVVTTHDATEHVELVRAQAEAREAAEVANRSKSEFLSRMSHELRTPLNAVLGFAQLLEMDELADEQREAVEHILKAGRHLLDLINEVLDISRIETGNMSLSPEPVQVADVVGDALAIVRPLADRAGIRLRSDTGAWADRWVLADRQRVQQVLLNLLSNAIKYNRPDGAVTVSCEPAVVAEPAGAPERLRIAVVDTGLGLGDGELARLFVPFDRLGAEQRDIEGTGMGLAVSRRLAEAMGGAVDVTSTPGVGSTFWIELPIAEAIDAGASRPPPVAAPVAVALSEERHTVLYIEDNLANLTLMERLLAHRADIALLPAMQGRLGLELARRHRPVLVLLDLHLPDTGGEAVLRELRSDADTADIPVVIITADATPGQERRLLAAGAASFLSKPFDVPTLLDLLDHTLPAAPPTAPTAPA
jgi:PAS domain S-box-containing protein